MVSGREFARSDDRLGLEADRLRRLHDGCVAGVDEVTIDDDPLADALGPADRPAVR